MPSIVGTRRYSTAAWGRRTIVGLTTVLIGLAAAGCGLIGGTGPTGPAPTPTLLRPSATAAPLDAIFAEMPATFTFSSGAGGWATTVTINPDGSFTGHYLDSNMGETGPGYPNGSAEESIFTGSFSVTGQVSVDEYDLALTNLTVQGTVGQTRIDGGVQYTTADPYGFDQAGAFKLYLPGRSTADLPEQFLNWVGMPNSWTSTPATLPFWGLYNVGGEEGFWG